VKAGFSDLMFRPLPTLTVATTIALVILLGLGTWQMQRREEKHAQLREVTQRQSSAPAPVEYVLPLGDYGAFRKVTAIGRFTHGNEAYVFTPRSEDGPARMGFRVITPFVLAGGDTILVDRGWVPESKRDAATRTAGQPEGVIKVEGSLRRQAPGGFFTPPPDTERRIFYARNSDTISHSLGLKLRSKLILEADSAVTGGPEPLPTLENLPDNHLNYALTWYSLAIVLIGVYLRYHYMQGRLRFRP